MAYLIAPRYQRKRFFRPRRRDRVARTWRFVRRYQLVELFVLTGGIALVWLGAHLDNQPGPLFELPPLGTESASVDLTVEAPISARLTPHRPL